MMRQTRLQGPVELEPRSPDRAELSSSEDEYFSGNTHRSQTEGERPQGLFPTQSDSEGELPTQRGLWKSGEDDREVPGPIRRK
jgi:hypothetical protein